MKKWILWAVVIVLVIAGAALFYLSGLEIGADTVNDEATQSVVSDKAQESSLITLDDSRTEVKPGENLVFNVSVNFLTWAIAQSGDTDISEKAIIQAVETLTGSNSDQTASFFIQTSLINKSDNTDPDTKYTASDHRINVTNLMNKNFYGFNIDVPVTVPTSAQKDNVMTSKIYLLKRTSTCSASDARLQRIRCAYAKLFQGATACESGCSYTWEKIAEATDVDTIDASANNVDLAITKLETAETIFGYWKSPLPTDRTINASIANLGNDYAANVKVIMKAPKGTISKEVPIDSIFSEQTATDGSKLDVLTWNYSSLNTGSTKNLSVKFTPEDIAVCTDKYNLTLTVSSDGTDVDSNNNSKTLQFKSNGCEWISQLKLSNTKK
jgi:hypothetical protein